MVQSSPKSRFAALAGVLLCAAPILAGPLPAAEPGLGSPVEAFGPPESPGPPDHALPRQVARQLARLDERLDLGSFPDGSPLWPPRLAAALDHRAASAAGEEPPGRVLLRQLAMDLRRLGAVRGLGGPPQEPGRPPEPPGKERAERLRRVLETVRLVHEKLDRAEGGHAPENRLARRAAPGNDDCASAQAIGVGTFTGTTAEATNDGSASCGSSGSSPDVWFSFTAPADETYVFDTFGSSFDTILSLLAACDIGDGRTDEIACSDDADGTVQSKLVHPMVAGESVVVRLSGFSGAAGAYTLHVAENRGLAGVVTRGDTGETVAGAVIRVFGHDNVIWPPIEGTTEADGSYFVNLPPGTYHITAASPGLIGELYDDIPCTFIQVCSVNEGAPVTVETGVTEGVDFALEAAANLSGALTDAATTDPLPGFVYLFGATGGILDSFFADSDGTYEVEGLPSGKYYLQAEAWGYRSEVYDDIPCVSSCSPTSGTQIVVAAGDAVAGLDFALDRNPSIEGTLTEEGTGAPIASQEVALYGPGGSWVDWAFTLSDGSYRFDSVAAGSYFVRTFTSHHLDELYDDLPCEPTCTVTSGTAVEAVLGSEVSAIDFVLGPKGSIAGTVTDAASGTPLDMVSLTVHDEAGRFVTAVLTSPDGSYEVPGLERGTHFVLTNASAYLNEVYDDVLCESSCDVTTGTPVTVEDGITTSGIDFALQRLGAVAGRVTDRLTGAPIAGARIDLYGDRGLLPVFESTASDGSYEVEGVPPGTYFVATETSLYRDEAYDDVPIEWGSTAADKTPVEVRLEQTTTGIDFGLDRLGFVEGTVTARGTGQALASDLYLLDAVGTVVGWDWTSGGVFRIDGLPPGSYYLKTDTSWLGSGFQDELFDDVPCDPDCDVSLGTPLPVQLNGGVVGVNFTLGLCPVNSYEDLLNTSIFSTFTAEACERVSGTGVRVAPGADVTFKAGRTVVLGDGFQVEEGGTFRAVIEPAWAEH